jgi:hypothetical protein
MHAYASAGAAFLVAVLWFDLMFDVQVRGHQGDCLPAEALASISAYYRRVTLQARPMNRLISVVMLLTLTALVFEIVRGRDPWWLSWGALAAAASGIGLAGARTVRNAVRLGRGEDDPTEQSRLARLIWRDHLFCLGAMSLAMALQLSARG